jgi:hypothetical protein
VISFFILLCSLSPAWAGSTQNHKPHVHGAGKLTIATETPTSLSVALDIPGDSIFGFEHPPHTDAEKATQTKAFADLRSNADKVIQFDPSLGCHTVAKQVEIEAESGPHQDVNASYSVECKKAPTGSQARIGLFTLFNRIHTLDVQILTDSGQSEKRVQSANDPIDL